MHSSARKRLIQFGAGSIGRSFIGQLFAAGGWEVVFIDIDQEVIRRINEKRAYIVVLKETGKPDELITVGPVRGVDGNDHAAVVTEIVEGDLISTSVGKNALPCILPVIAEAVALRGSPIDIILAENMINGSELVSKLMLSHLPPNFPLSERLGIVETSIGKMVPIMRTDQKKEDPLAVFAEPYNTLILDKNGFINPIPDIENIKTVDNIKAYVDRKLFIHNLGHAAAAYLGNSWNSSFRYIWEVLEVPELNLSIRAAMTRSAEALLLEYPEVFTRDSLEAHIEDLLSRFRNRALGDTIYRVGRGLFRKLHKEDRILGAMKLIARHNLALSPLVPVFTAACTFRAADEQGKPFDRDREFQAQFSPTAYEKILTEVSRLDRAIPYEDKLIESILAETAASPHGSLKGGEK